MNTHPLRETQRAFVHHLLAEHRQLNKDLRSVSEQMAQASKACDASCRARLIQRLDGLRAMLHQHFAEEEQGGCIEEAVSFQPQLAAEAREIERQHPQLLTQLDDITFLARDNAAPAELVGKFARFSAALMAHEAGENRIISRGFNLGHDAEFDDLTFADESTKQCVKP